MWSFMNYVKLIKSMEALIGSIYDESASPLYLSCHLTFVESVKALVDILKIDGVSE